MRQARVRALAGGSLAVSALLSALAAAFLVLGWKTPVRPTEFGVKGYAISWSLVVGAVGALIAARRPANPIGWIFCALGVVSGLIALATEYARWALFDQAGGPPAGPEAAWVVEWAWMPLIVGIGVVAAIFPEGRPLSRRWGRATWAAAAASAVPVVLNAVLPRLTTFGDLDNPFGVGGPAVRNAATVSTFLLIPIMAVGTGAAVVRFHRSRGDERFQLKWLVTAMSLIVAMFGVYGVLITVQGTTSPTTKVIGLHALEYATIATFLSVPVSIAFGVLKYRLYDIDFVITRTVVYGAMAVFVTGVYLAVVIATGSLIGYASNPVLSAIAAAIVALAFQPVRRRAQRLANRVVFGRRATPYEVLSELSSRFAGAYSIEDALPRLARVTAEAVGAERAAVWLRDDGALRAAASWPGDGVAATLPMRGEALPTFGLRETGFPVRHQGDVLGAVSVVMPPTEPLGPAQAKLLEDVAAHAGLVLRNVALLEDLRASRKRIVAAQDERARKLERNIHDGAQQQLVALTVKLRLAQGLVTKDPAKAEAMLADLQGDTQTALEDLRDLARGIYPPLLADKGLREALQAQSRKAALPVRVEADSIGRYAQDVEAAVYFCALEALQNVAKYARASSIAVSLRARDGALEFAIEDDGAGFDPATTPRGSGLQSMRDRMEALGGALEVLSAAGRGTTISGRLPAEKVAGS